MLFVRVLCVDATYRRAYAMRCGSVSYAPVYVPQGILLVRNTVWCTASVRYGNALCMRQVRQGMFGHGMVWQCTAVLRGTVGYSTVLRVVGCPHLAPAM